MKRNYTETLYKNTRKTIKKMGKYQWRYRNLILLAISFAVAYQMLKDVRIVSLLTGFGSGYPAAFISGLLFSYGLTAPVATVAIFNIGHSLNPFLIAFIGAFGAVLSDYIIFRFVRDRLAGEILSLSREINKLRKPISSLVLEEELIVRLWKRISRSKIWHVIIPVIAGFIIASPLPDELGAALFGAIKFDAKKFVIISYLLNFTGILFIALSTKVFS